MLTALVFIFGLIVGSFLNAVIYRLHVGTSFAKGRSFCPKCKTGLTVLDLVPILSFVLLRARCRHCKKKISWQYPLVEFGTALTFVLISFRMQEWYGMSMTLFIPMIIYFIIAAFLVVIFMYDLLHYLILDSVIVPAAIFSIVANMYLGVSIVSMLVAALVGAGFFALQFFISRGAWIGGGDIRLGALMGVILGWPLVAVALFISYMIGGGVGIGLLAAGKKKMGSKLPFGTFLTIGTFITMLYGSAILDWYIGSTFL